MAFPSHQPRNASDKPGTPVNLTEPHWLCPVRPRPPALYLTLALALAQGTAGTAPTSNFPPTGPGTRLSTAAWIREVEARAPGSAANYCRALQRQL